MYRVENSAILLQILLVSLAVTHLPPAWYEEIARGLVVGSFARLRNSRGYLTLSLVVIIHVQSGALRNLEIPFK